VATLVAEVLDSPTRRQAIVDAQRQRLQAFSHAAIADRLAAAAAFLRDGCESSFFVSSQMMTMPAHEDGWTWSRSRL
jgi:hypothetical protein